MTSFKKIMIAIFVALITVATCIPALAAAKSVKDIVAQAEAIQNPNADF